jgi:death-on-curing protein
MTPEAVWVPTLNHYVVVASVVLGINPEAIERLPNLKLADSALNAPFAEFGGVAAYEGVVAQASVLIALLSKNHPLPDGNKRAAFMLTLRFLDANGYHWLAEDVEADAGMVERIAASDATHGEIVSWIESRTSAG